MRDDCTGAMEGRAAAPPPPPPPAGTGGPAAHVGNGFKRARQGLCTLRVHKAHGMGGLRLAGGLLPDRHLSARTTAIQAAPEQVQLPD